MEITTDITHILLDSKCTESGGNFCFRSMDEILESGLLKGGTRENPVTLYIAPGVYWMHDIEKDGPTPPRNGKGLPCEKTVRFGWLKMIGLSGEPGQVVLASRKGQAFGCIGNYTMFSFEGEGLWVSNLTFGNYCNVDLEYPWQPALSCPKRSAAITQAQLASFNGKELLAENCRFVSRLNLLPICGADKSVYRNCHFECTDDSLNGHAIYEDCDFDFYGGCPFWATERAGVIFRKCLFRVHTQRLQLAKHEGQMAFVDCGFLSEEDGRTGSANIGQMHEGAAQEQSTGINQTQSGDAVREQNAEIVKKQSGDIHKSDLKIYEMGTTWNGKTFSLRQLGLKADALPQAFLHWTEESPVNLKISAAVSSLAKGAELEITSSVISFFGKEILDEIVYFEASVGQACEESIFAEQIYSKDRHCSEEISRESDGQQFKLILTGSGQCIIQNCNKGMEVVEVNLRAYTADGLNDEIIIKLLPECREIPDFKSYPTIRRERGSLRTAYQLDIPSELEDSLIVWYRLPKGAGEEEGEQSAIKGSGRMDRGIAIARGRGRTAAEYTPDMDDAGHRLYAEVCAAARYGDLGEPYRTGTYKIMPEDILHKYQKETDFRMIPLENRVGKGVFLFHAYTPAVAEMPPEWRIRGGELPGQPWNYGELGGGCVGSGLYPMQQGSSIIYEPSWETGRNMYAEVLVDTAKTAGQGFGSVGQYMDIILRFAPDSHGMGVCGGLAVRVRRTVQASDGVEFGLIRYENGVSVPLTEPVVVSCFQTGCRILAETVGDSFQAEISCTSSQNDTQKQKGWLHHASLSVKLPSVQKADSRLACSAGFCLLHTGTCGDKGWFNTIMLHKIRIWYN